ncbi:30S ribosomal protein S8 [Candidatus Microgenomates bacterium]|nr:30S ribosomal protein S8 [Candidatus Microgenomates bacterium]
MVTNDPISDMLTRVRNGYMARNSVVEVSWSKMKENLAKILADAGYISKVTVLNNNLNLDLKYHGKVPAITEIKRVSKPSLRVYVSKDNLPRVLGGMGIAVLSTPKGLMTDKQAHKNGVGGEVICEVY